MPLLFTIGWSWMSSAWGGFIFPLLAKIPWQVWAGIGLVVAFFWYGHVRENRGYEKCHVQVVEAANKEKARQQEAADEAVKEAQSRATESAQRAQSLQEDLDATQKQVGELKNAKTVCLPGSITGQFDGSRVRKRK